MATVKPIPGKGGEILLYQSKDGRTTLDVRLEHESVWLTQKHMADLFGKNTDTIGLHIRNIYKEKELSESATTEDSSVVRTEGGRRVKRKIKYYNLDVIISVGYRVKSQRGTQFRIWATQVLREHLPKGYTLFIWFLDANGLLYRTDGTKRLADNALVALTLLIAESNPAEKDALIAVIVNLINRENL